MCPAAIAAALYSRVAKTGVEVVEFWLEGPKAPEDAFGEGVRVREGGANEVGILVGISPVVIWNGS